MKLERTLSIIKPDILKKNNIGKIINRFEKNGLKVIALKMIRLDQKIVKNFYNMHRDKPFFSDLIKFMISGPVIVQILEGKNAVLKNRLIMGNTDPKKASNKGTSFNSETIITSIAQINIAIKPKKVANFFDLLKICIIIINLIEKIYKKINNIISI